MTNQRTNIEVANIWIGYVFAKLYESFPIPYDFKLSEILDETGEVPTIGESGEFGLQLLMWLRDEGYVRGQDGTLELESLMDFTVLTERGLTALNAVPDKLAQKKKIGEQLVDASKDLGKEGIKKGVMDLIGQVIGGVIKSTVT